MRFRTVRLRAERCARHAVAAVLAGQSIASLAIDHFGWVGFPEHPISAGRLAGLVLLAAGVVLVRVF